MGRKDRIIRATVRIDDVSVLEYVRKHALLPEGGALRVAGEGDGNINYVRRVQAVGGPSVVVKHARPTLERFPEYRAPVERIHFEHAYFEVVRSVVPDEKILPRILHFDPSAALLVLEDLGTVPRLEDALLDGEVPEDALHAIGRYLASVHDATRPIAPRLVSRFRNDEMRRLHGEHIFSLPFEPNDFPVPTAVREEASRLIDAAVRRRIDELRRAYYGSAEALVHGDVQPTNILLTPHGQRLLDAEIAHVGDPAFDLGVLLGHLRMHTSGDHRGQAALLAGYGGSLQQLERALAYGAVEMLRRTLGAARVRAVSDPATAIAVLNDAVGILR